MKKDIVSTLISTETRIDMLVDLLDSKISEDRRIEYGSMCGILDTLKGIKADVSMAHETLMRGDQGRLEKIKEQARERIREKFDEWKESKEPKDLTGTDEK